MLEVEINLEKPVSLIIGDILAVATARRQADQVAQHLVGAKLSLRYPGIEVENHSFTTSNPQIGREGDFVVGDTVFHVTMTPLPAVVEKIAVNIRNGYRAILLVPDVKTASACQMVEMFGLHNLVGIYDLESFVGRTPEELGEFERSRLTTGLRTLLEKYNESVVSAGIGRSFLIEIPENL